MYIKGALHVKLDFFWMPTKKKSRDQFLHGKTKTTTILELVQLDMCKFLLLRSIASSSYFMIIVNDLIEKIWVYFLHKKS